MFVGHYGRHCARRISGVRSAIRFLNSLLAIWVFISAFVLPHVTAATVWNNALLAVAIFIVPFVGPVTRSAWPHVQRTV